MRVYDQTRLPRHPLSVASVRFWSAAQRKPRRKSSREHWRCTARQTTSGGGLVADHSCPVLRPKRNADANTAIHKPDKKTDIASCIVPDVHSQPKITDEMSRDILLAVFSSASPLVRSSAPSAALV